MKFTLSREALKQALSRTSVLPSGKAVASAQFVKISAFVDTLTVERFSAESLVAMDCEATNVKEGDPIFANSTSLLSVISCLPGKEVTIESGFEDGKIRIESGGVKAALRVLDDIFFQPPSAPEGRKLQIKCEDFRAILSGIAQAMSRDSSQGVLAGVGIRRINDKLTFLASDRRRCHSVTRDFDLDVDVVIPFESVDALLKLLDGQPGETTVTFGASSLEAVCARSRAILPLMEETFPKSINALLGASSKSLEIRVQREQLIEAIKTCSVVGEGEGKTLSWKVSEESLILHGNNRRDSEMTIELSCVSSEPSKAEFSGPFLSDAVSFIEPDNDGMVTLEQTPQNAFFLRSPNKLAFVALVAKQPEK